MGSKVVDLTGQVFGRLTAIEFSHSGKGGHIWKCKCECGREVFASRSELKRKGGTKSCGCLKREILSKLRHGMSKTPIYTAWHSMRERCNNPNHEFYHHYGGRDISVCGRWNLFENFYEDMGPKPSPKHTLDRINNDGNYEPSNCRWATQKEQCSNRRNNVFVIYKGEKKTISELARQEGMLKSTLARRIKKGMSVEEAVTRISQRSRKYF